MSDEAFAGLPIKGTKRPGADPLKEQHPREELASALRAVVERPEVAAVRWRQYTPYFNDGDPCVFGVGEIGVAFIDLPFSERGCSYEEFGGEYDDGFFGTYSDEFNERVGKLKYHYNQGDFSYTVETSPDPELAKAVLNAFEAVQGGHHKVSLEDLFGDHAVVTVYKDRIDIEEYEHD